VPPSFTVGGTVSGLAAGTQLILNDNGSDSLTVSTDGLFTFAQPVPLDSGLGVTVAAQPLRQLCTVTNGSSTHVTASVTGISVTCASRPELASY
jgi:hypothetical protein